MTTFFSYSAMNTTLKDLTICTLSKALLQSQIHQRDRAFSQIRKPVRLTCSEILQKCEIDTERTTEVHFTQLLWLDTWNPPACSLWGDKTSAWYIFHLPWGGGESDHRCCRTCLLSDNPKLCKYPYLFLEPTAQHFIKNSKWGKVGIAILRGTRVTG